jgi:chemotaxis protein MotB
MANAPHHGDIIIIKKKISGGHGHHGGAWKIAFADFMTAMMAFFLVLWIINATDKETKTVIARYFNPVKLENPSKATKGVHGSNSAPIEGKDDKYELPPGPPAKDKDATGVPPPARGTGRKPNPSPQPGPPIEAKTQAAEAKLFSEPYEALDRIAGGREDSAPGASPDKGDSDPQRLGGALSIDSFRDPFKPIGPGSPDDPNAFDADARQKAPPALEPGKTGPDDQLNVKPTPGPTPSQKAHDKLVAGAPAAPAPSPSDTGKTAESAAEAAKLEQTLKAQVAAALKSAAGPEIEAHQTKEGLLISLTDSLAFSMFSVGSAEPRPELVRAMAAIAKVIKTKPGHIVVRGYTDARPYRNGAYDNWRLSSDRAEMAYYMLTRGGAPAARFVRVEGYADRALKDPADPLSAVNRRLEILIEGPKP